MQISRIYSIPINCKDNKGDKENFLNQLIDKALKGIREKGKAQISKDEVSVFVQ